MKRKAKTKGNLKGKITSKRKKVKIEGVEYIQTTTIIPIEWKDKYSLVAADDLEEKIRRIIREELDKKLRITYKDFWETRQENEEKPFWMTGQL